MTPGAPDLSPNVPGLSFSVVVPSYNPGERLRPNVERIIEVCSGLLLPFEVVVVCDGSLDESLSTLSNAAAEVRTIRHLSNHGKGAALQTGMLASRGELVAFIDADGDIDPEVLPRMLLELQAGQVDVVVGSKNEIKEAVNYPLHRRVPSALFSTWVRMWLRLPVKETQVGAKAFRRDQLLRALPYTTEEGFAFDVDLLAALTRTGVRKMAQEPVLLAQTGPSTVTLRRAAEAFSAVVRVSRVQRRIGKGPVALPEQRVEALEVPAVRRAEPIELLRQPA